jgi:SAM-dependent methyltransferase
MREADTETAGSNHQESVEQLSRAVGDNARLQAELHGLFAARLLEFRHSLRSVEESLRNIERRMEALAAADATSSGCASSSTRVSALTTTPADAACGNGSLRTVDTILSQLVQRVLQLEGQYRELRESLAADRQRPLEINPQSLNFGLEELSKKSRSGKPHFTYMTTRFRDFENALRNIRNLAASRDTEYYQQYARPASAGPRFFPLKAKACVEEDIRSEWAAFWSQELRMPVAYHRKFWELCYVPQILYNEGKLHEGSCGLGFACGEEPLPSLFAKYGVRVLATDLEPTRAEAQGWLKSNQHVGHFEKLRRRDICGDEARLMAIEGRYLDMNAIPADLHDKFDFCWSVCSIEHLGSIANGLSFVENSLHTLKPGGISVHTMEFNLDDGETVDNWPTVLFQKRHLLLLAERLKARGFLVYDFDFDHGHGILDGFVDLPPYFDADYPLQNSHAHLKLSIDGFVCTSFGFVVKKPAI